MARLKELWRCGCCKSLYDTQKEAIDCAKSHVRRELWAFGKGTSAYRVFANCAPGSYGSIDWAMEMADKVEERK